MTQEAGDPSAFPESVYVPDDSAAPTAAEFNPAIEGLLDRTAFLGAQLRSAALLNWSSKVTLTWARAAAWCPYFRAWYVADKNGPYIQTSVDSGRTWTQTAVAGVTQADVVERIRCDMSGNAVAAIVNNGSGADRVWESSGGTWTRRAVTGFAATSTAGGVVWDPVANLWTIAQSSVAGVGLVATSAGRVTWTSASPSADFTSGVSRVAMAIRPDTGRTLLVGHKDATDVFVSASRNTGAAWVAGSGWASAADPTALELVHYEGDTWLLVAGSGATTSRVYRSTDNGATWSLLATLTAVKIRSVVVVGRYLLGYAVTASAGLAVYSADGGATWRYGNHRFEDGVDGREVAYGGGQVLAVASQTVWPGMRSGTPGEVIT